MLLWGRKYVEQIETTGPLYKRLEAHFSNFHGLITLEDESTNIQNNQSRYLVFFGQHVIRPINQTDILTTLPGAIVFE